MKTLAAVLGQYRLDTREYPSEEQGLEALIVQPAGQDKWQGPYMTAIYLKTLGITLTSGIMRHAMPMRTYEGEILSLGADGQLGGTGKNKVITRGF